MLCPHSIKVNKCTGSYNHVNGPYSELCVPHVINKLVEGCNENIDENEMIYNNTLNDYKHLCGSCAS